MKLVKQVHKCIMPSSQGYIGHCFQAFSCTEEGNGCQEDCERKPGCKLPVDETQR